jgi:hypothetical protein
MRTQYGRRPWLSSSARVSGAAVGVGRGLGEVDQDPVDREADAGQEGRGGEDVQVVAAAVDVLGSAP